MKLTEWDVNLIILTLDYLDNLSSNARERVETITAASREDTTPEKNVLLHDLLEAQINLTKILTQLFEGEE